MIKQPVLFGISGIALFFTVLMFLWSGWFYLNSAETTGTVMSVVGTNSRCGGKHKHDCTRFDAVIEYTVAGKAYRIHREAGDSRGRNQPVSDAKHHGGQRVPILYNALSPSEGCRDTVWDLWGAPMMGVVVQVTTMVGSLFEGRRRSSSLSLF